MPRKDLIDLTGQRFGRWLVLAFDHAQSATFWQCRCDCGTARTVSGDSLRRGRSTNCGCFAREKTAQQAKRLFTTHGHTTNHSTSPEYRSWYAMIQRCKNPKRVGFKNYGGRGITVCRRWEKSFPAFLADMGLKPTRAHTINRKNNEGNYTPRNCHWATKKEQANNSRRWSNRHAL